MTAEITKQYREEFFGTHLGQCAGLTVEHSEETTSVVELLEFRNVEATLSCPHGLRSAFEFEYTVTA